MFYEFQVPDNLGDRLKPLTPATRPKFIPYNPF